jgi:hypothetical protein
VYRQNDNIKTHLKETAIIQPRWETKDLVRTAKDLKDTL